MREIRAQQFAADGRVRHHALAPALGGLGSHAQQPVSGIEIVGAQAAQLLAPQSRVVAEGEHGAVADRFAPGRLQDGAPVRLIRDPGQPHLARDQPAPAVAAHAGTGRVAAAADRVGVTQPLLDQVVVEQADGCEALLHRRIGQARASGGRDSGSAPACRDGRSVRWRTKRATCSRLAVSGSAAAAAQNARYSDKPRA